jgi:hypothetical protein
MIFKNQLALVFFICLLGGILASYPAPSAAWSSKDIVIFQPVHQMAISNVLGSAIKGHELDILHTQQTLIDQDQMASESFEHAMTGTQSKQATQSEIDSFIKKSNAFVADHLHAAINAWTAHDNDAAFAHLGKAIHTLEDASSPVHAGFQPWRDNETWYEVAAHIDREKTYPTDEMVRRELEGSVKWAYDIMVAKATFPPLFFGPKGGLQLPPQYRK